MQVDDLHLYLKCYSSMGVFQASICRTLLEKSSQEKSRNNFKRKQLDDLVTHLEFLFRKKLKHFNFLEFWPLCFDQFGHCDFITKILRKKSTHFRKIIIYNNIYKVSSVVLLICDQLKPFHILWWCINFHWWELEKLVHWLSVSQHLWEWNKN